MTTRHLLHWLLALPIILPAFTPGATRAATHASGTWTMTGSMHETRALQTATLLPSGLVLIAGGNGAQGTLASAELYHPNTGSWASTGSMHEPRVQYTATLLSDGQVLAVGGFGSQGLLASAELYHPRTGIWTVTGSLHQARANHTATLLPDGKVLVAGGDTNGANNGAAIPLAGAEVYDPRTGKWTQTGSLHRARADLTATLLPDGQVLVAGGGASGVNNSTANPLVSAELYNPRTGWWSITGSMHHARDAHMAILLRSGLVLVAGSSRYTKSGATAELYDPRTGRWTVTGSLHQGHAYQTGQTATLLPNGQVLVEGYVIDLFGNPSADAELYDPRTGRWTLTGSLQDARLAASATLLPNGRVLVAGGQGSNRQLASAELYQP